MHCKWMSKGLELGYPQIWTVKVSSSPEKRETGHQLFNLVLIVTFV